MLDCLLLYCRIRGVRWIDGKKREEQLLCSGSRALHCGERTADGELRRHEQGYTSTIHAIRLVDHRLQACSDQVPGLETGISRDS